PQTTPLARALLTLDLIQTRPGITADHLAATLDVSDRAVRRTIATLREAGVPIDSTSGPYGGYRAGRGLRLPPLTFTAAEALSLVMAALDGHHDAADPAGLVGRALGKITRALPEQVAVRAEAVRHATADDPLRILVTGDSLSDFDGRQLARMVAADHLPAKVRVQARTGTGLTQPSVFDWSDEAAQDAADYDPDVVIMVLGANDGWPLHGADVGSNAWNAEYSRRVEAVSRDFIAGDPQRRVYWVGPPVPRSAPWIHIFARIDDAVRAAVPNVPGLRYVDVAGPTSDHGRYTDYLTDAAGHRVLARQHDGIHFSFPGSVFPARIILAALRGEYTLG
ncbi:DUF459 domain-containing protein, partial [Catenulispora rubra]|uniref:DUF459 domain-containing protein n=1 Tax=Catenulispora rubra TaxID=280293 RepID=UPI0018925E18